MTIRCVRVKLKKVSPIPCALLLVSVTREGETWSDRLFTMRAPTHDQGKSLGELTRQHSGCTHKPCCATEHHTERQEELVCECLAMLPSSDDLLDSKMCKKMTKQYNL